MRIAVCLVLFTLLTLATRPAAAQGDDADKKLVNRLVADMYLVPSLYARGEGRMSSKTLPKFSATKLFGYPLNKKETAESERKFWMASKEVYGNSTPLRAALFEAMDQAEKLQALQFPMTVLGEKAPKGDYFIAKNRLEFMKNQEALAKSIFSVEQILPQMKAAAEKRDMETSRRWQANFDLGYTRTLGNLVYLYEYSYALGLIRADSLPDLGKGDDGWKIAFRAGPTVTEPKAKQYARERSKLLQKMQVDHAGTPWAYFAERDSKRDLGMTWVAKKK
jgi:hypothetical protein